MFPAFAAQPLWEIDDDSTFYSFLLYVAASSSPSLACCHALGDDLVNFAPFGHRSLSSSLPCVSVTDRTAFTFVFPTLLVRHIACLSLLPCIRVYKPPRLALPRQGKNRRNRSPFFPPTFRMFSRDRGLTPLITSLSLIPNSPLGFPSLPFYTSDG